MLTKAFDLLCVLTGGHDFREEYSGETEAVYKCERCGKLETESFK